MGGWYAKWGKALAPPTLHPQHPPSSAPGPGRLELKILLPPHVLGAGKAGEAIHPPHNLEPGRLRTRPLPSPCSGAREAGAMCSSPSSLPCGGLPMSEGDMGMGAVWLLWGGGDLIRRGGAGACFPQPYLHQPPMFGESNSGTSYVNYKDILLFLCSLEKGHQFSPGGMHCGMHRQQYRRLCKKVV